MIDDTPRLKLPFILPSQAQKHVTHNEALAQLDLLVQLTVEEFEASTPPATATEGQVWALGATPVGAWAGRANALAAWQGGAWVFIAPQPGWRAALGTDLRLWSGMAWDRPALPDIDMIAGLGVNSTHDAENRLTVSSAAALFSHDGGDHRLKINKAAESDTASVLFQTGWSGRAEIGLAGDDSFSIKVSGDGSVWHEGLVIEEASGHVRMPNGLQVTGPVSGSAVTQSDLDTTPGRLLRVDHANRFPQTVTFERQLTGTEPGIIMVSQGGPSFIVRSDAFSGLANNIRFRQSGANSNNLALVVSAGDDTSRAIALRGGPGGGFVEASNSLRVRVGNTLGTAEEVLRLFSDGAIRAATASGWVGDVSTSGYSAILQRGSNANGEFVRLADGTQVCTRTIDMGARNAIGAGNYTDPFRTDQLDVAFAAAFAAVPAVSVSFFSDNSTAANRRMTSGIRRVETSQIVQLQAVAATGETGNGTVFAQVIAIGRWY